MNQIPHAFLLATLGIAAFAFSAMHLRFASEAKRNQWPLWPHRAITAFGFAGLAILGVVFWPLTCVHC